MMVSDKPKTLEGTQKSHRVTARFGFYFYYFWTLESNCVSRSGESEGVTILRFLVLLSHVVMLDMFRFETSAGQVFL